MTVWGLRAQGAEDACGRSPSTETLGLPGVALAKPGGAGGGSISGKHCKPGALRFGRISDTLEVSPGQNAIKGAETWSPGLALLLFGWH